MTSLEDARRANHKLRKIWVGDKGPMLIPEKDKFVVIEFLPDGRSVLWDGFPTLAEAGTFAKRMRQNPLGAKIGEFKVKRVKERISRWGGVKSEAERG